MGTELLALIAGHFLCSAAAERDMLSSSQMAQCAAIYQQMKLAFSEIEEPRDYFALPAEDRARVSAEGYAAYQTWMDKNPHVVSQLRTDAQTQVAALGF